MTPLKHTNCAPRTCKLFLHYFIKQSIFYKTRTEYTPTDGQSIYFKLRLINWLFGVLPHIGNMLAFSQEELMYKSSIE